MPDEEIDFDAAKPLTKAQEVVKHFSADPPAEIKKAVDAEIDPLVEDFGNLSYTELCPQLMAQYSKAKAELDRWTEIQKALRAEILRLAHEKRGSYPVGDYVLSIDEKRGQTTIDWEAVAQEWMHEKDYKGILADKELVKQGKLDHKFIKQGKPSQTVTVKKLEGK